jgi:hypothetical protein|tara:strand:+ start:354 stop:614 length:261 start_codon:yes stop_codon:yes gene_type:complete
MLNNKDGKLYVENYEVIKGYESFWGWYWFVTEIEEEDYEGHPLYFGYVQGLENEFGSIWMGQLQPLIEQGTVWEIKEEDLPHAGRR